MRSTPSRVSEPFDRAHEVHGAESRVVGVRADAHAQQRAVALPAGSQPLADDVLAATAGEAVGRVDRIAAELDVAVEDAVAGLEVDVPAELRSTQHQREGLEAGLAERDADRSLLSPGPTIGMGAEGCSAALRLGALARRSCAYAEQPHTLTPASIGVIRSASPALDAPPGAYFEGKRDPRTR